MDSNTPSRQSISAPNRAGHEEVEESDNEAENRLSSVQQDNGNLQYRLELVDILGMTKLYHAETETARRLPARDRKGFRPLRIKFNAKDEYEFNAKIIADTMFIDLDSTVLHVEDMATSFNLARFLARHI
ncbi:hypothetical protein NKR19_g4868 [Coniochaeta hoffmannii]|uniref:Uncharacterized protein n=1 Tax=Coniochaeta hoffmannii TaxID=91930 RepID=A0AA38VU60_9PEZI|nr:hypothetical protein NKR19_g4868 [Coniochaeta hoffmannii]